MTCQHGVIYIYHVKRCGRSTECRIITLSPEFCSHTNLLYKLDDYCFCKGIHTPSRNSNSTASMMHIDTILILLSRQLRYGAIQSGCISMIPQLVSTPEGGYARKRAGELFGCIYILGRGRDWKGTSPTKGGGCSIKCVSWAPGCTIYSPVRHGSHTEQSE